MKSKSELVDALCQIRQRAEMTRFLQELLTEKEMEDVIFRWRLMKDLYKGETQRFIAKKILSKSPMTDRHAMQLIDIIHGAPTGEQQ